MPKRPPTLTPALKWREREGYRLSAAERGYTRRWHTYRNAYLRSNPLCAGCLERGRTTAATVVDHIIPAVDAPDLFYTASNHQSLCRSCHAVKTAAEAKLRNAGVIVKGGVVVA